MPLASLELSQVLYDDSSYFSLALALITLSPILLMPSYAALAIVTREITIINMWAGQFCCEAFNLVVKRIVKQGRPPGSVANGYGFPSSHSQYMGYFATFLILHLHFRHKFVISGSSDSTAFRIAIYTAIVAWAALVAYSRYYLSYHSVSQILWGVCIGVSFGGSFYVVAELIPTWRPNSLLGRVRTYIFRNPISRWLRIRDGWAVWEDGGWEGQWQLWDQLWRKRTKPAVHVN
ncbi:PAP2-domain-containing protein [Russula aff. rugulosa BPL654]|nr:PAP2-domain-containing protein [Russula aff. rugulosa BPL654]